MPDDLKGFGQSQRNVYLTHIRNGMQRGAAAEALGLNRKKVREYIATHGDFEELVADAETDAAEHVQEALYQAAINGSVSAARTWLELRGMGTEPSVAARPNPAAPTPSRDGFADLDNVSPIEVQRRRRSQ